MCIAPQQVRVLILTRRNPPEPHEILMNEAVRIRTQTRAQESDRKHREWKIKVLRLICIHPYSFFTVHFQNFDNIACTQKHFFQKEKSAKLEDEKAKADNLKEEFYVNPEAETEEWTPK